MKYCSNCGSALKFETPPGDDRARFLCAACGAVHYQNPRVVAGCIPEAGGRILLCRRAIDPRYGKWTLPAGYLENGETVSACAERETLEETGARVGDLAPYLLFNICHINQIYLMFRGRVVDAGAGPGKESLEVRMFTEDEIPWDQIAFRVITETLQTYFRDRPAGLFPFTIADIGPAPGQAFLPRAEAR
jgi:ADP-ribose pyrophosphatase YjhB (NUDIX family)